jgi:hypothetical protein
MQGFMFKLGIMAADTVVAVGIGVVLLIGIAMFALLTKRRS